MGRISTNDLHKRLHSSGVIAVLIIDDANDAVPLARALHAGGVDCIELTLRTDSAIESVRRIAAEVPEVVVGVGTILTPQQADAAKDAGADFGVAPGTNPRVIQRAIEIGLPFSPGVCTPTDIEMALELGCRVLKFFPSEPSGGLNYLKSAAAPYMHLGVKYIPLGGVSGKNAEEYLRDPNVMALGGSWLGPRDLIQKRDWAAITKLASEATEIVKRVRGTKA
ncbi:MAG: bifunctional 4-hydroxy-2-oxoglutarate aldolase/2-dehydro-3-deoxy-phosphogluconate aldolase [Candidatus Moraniibacteriota bacterium]|nr:MAG: bifunctional 4-hydroxy-2-oxoglutarate aldolase/2-dehydro-3-deoxy-phosphogluconate aldolase [Candidatus Moranbacteria bacterium]